jgi:predicted RNase H-like HicB family nuclease
MKKSRLTLEYWIDDGWYVGRLREVPAVMSQGETLADLEDNIQDAYLMLHQTAVRAPRRKVRTKGIVVSLA